MSRTFRRRKDKAPDWVTLDYIWVGSYCVRVPHNNIKKEIAKWHSDAGYHDDDYSGLPKWFNKLYHIRPSRRKTKLACKKVLQLIDYDNYPEFPIYKKPTEYYW